MKESAQEREDEMCWRPSDGRDVEERGGIGMGPFPRPITPLKKAGFGVTGEDGIGELAPLPYDLCWAIPRIGASCEGHGMARRRQKIG